MNYKNNEKIAETECVRDYSDVFKVIKKVYPKQKITCGDCDQKEKSYYEFYIGETKVENMILPISSLVYDPNNNVVFVSSSTKGELEQKLLSELKNIGIKSNLRHITNPDDWNMYSEPVIQIENYIGKRRKFFKRIKEESPIKKAIKYITRKI